MTDKTELQHDERHTSAEVLAMMGGKPFAGGAALALVRHWMMSGDYPVNEWECHFAAAIDAHHLATRAPDPTPVAWMPIESAPKDWTDVLVFSPEHEGFNCGGVFSAFYDEDDGAWITHGQSGNITVYPTYWMPLPSAPEQPQ